MTTEFTTIPDNRRKPGAPLEFSLKAGANSLQGNTQKVLIAAQKTGSGTAAANTPVRVYSEGHARGLFGAGSIAHIMCKLAIKANEYLLLYVLPLADAASSAAAVGSIAITGPATAPGRLTLYVGAVPVKINVASEDTAAEIATALKAALDNLPDLPVTAAVNSGTITLTAKNKGTLGNTIILSAETDAAGAAFTITAMTGGALDPDMEDALAIVAGERYHIIASPLNDEDSLAALAAHCEAVSAASAEKWGMGVFGYPSGGLAAACTLGGELNSWLLSGFYLRGSKTAPFEQAAVYAAVLAAEEDPARPLNTVEMTGVAAPAIADRLSDPEQESCLYNGVTPGEVATDGSVQIVRAITSYVKDGDGNADATLLDITTPRSLFYTAEAVLRRIRSVFPRAKRTAGKTATAVKTELLDVLRRLEAAEIVQNVAANQPDATDDPNNISRIIMDIPARVVPGAHIIAGQIRLVV
ncbi:MAG: phage tail sheath subtilisin-like domain-containing protein [Elusimicrobiales bacterium]